MKFKKVYIEITNICNKSCSFCDDGKRAKEQMTTDNFEHILKEINNLTNYVCLHVKGEPLLHYKIKEIFDLCDKYNKKVILTTNGTLLDKNIENIVSSPSIKQINISFNSIEEKDQLNQIQNNINIVDLLSKRVNITFVYRFWAQPKNGFNELDTMKLKILSDHYNIDINKMNEKSNFLIKENIYFNKNSLFEWPSLKNNIKGKEGFCYALKTHFAILVDGTVVACCLDSEGEIALGNIFKTDIQNILASQRAQKIKENFNKNIACEELCIKCSFKNRFKNMV